MKELSLHILDIVQNSLTARARKVWITIIEETVENILSISIVDNGCGIKKEVLTTITDPFATSRKSRRVGLGLSFLKLAAEQCNGSLSIESEEGKGTIVTATFEHDHIDRAPLGDMVSTLISFVIGSPDVDFHYSHRVNESVFEFNTEEVKQQLEGIPISDMSVVNFLTEYLQEQMDTLYKEADL